MFYSGNIIGDKLFCFLFFLFEKNKSVFLFEKNKSVFVCFLFVKNPAKK